MLAFGDDHVAGQEGDRARLSGERRQALLGESGEQRHATDQLRRPWSLGDCAELGLAVQGLCHPLGQPRVGLGAQVTILDRSLPRLRQLDDIFGGRIITRYSTVDALDEAVREADAVIGAVLIPGASAPKLVTRKMLKTMKPGAVLVDVAIDQGGCFETSKATTHANPTYEVDGIVHYCVANMPGAVALTSSHALNNATLQYGIQLANMGLQAIRDNVHLQNGLNVHRGMITNEAVAQSLKKKMVAPLKALETV